MKSLSWLLLALSLSASVARAQTGAWTDGELVLRSVSLPSGIPTLFRTLPESGATAPLAQAQGWHGWSGAAVFDAHRGGLLSNMSLAPDNPALGRLWLVSHDGTASAMPGVSGHLRALASAGDGRVFFLRHNGMAQGPRPVEYFDAQDVIHELKATDGVTPFQIEVEHLLYEPTGNALIGSSSAWWSASDCGALGSSLYRIPLSADGVRVAGPVTCTSISPLFANEEIMALDHMPGGKVLVTVASGNVPSVSTLLSLDPTTLAFSVWADPQQGDVDGGVWCARLGRAVIKATGPGGSELRSFGPGETGLGTLLPTSVVMPGSSGYSPAEVLFEVDVNGPACAGFQLAYGDGLAGKGGFVPLLGAIGCPDVGASFTLSINDVVGGAGGGLLVGLAPAALPFKGGTLHVLPLVAPFALTVGGAPGVAGAGSLALPATLPGVLAGIDLSLQLAFVDAAAPQGFALSNGLRLQGG